MSTTTQKATSANPKHQEPDNWNERLVCRRCQSLITHPQLLIEVADKLDHIQVNPSGITFLFRCFSRAPGAIETGTPSSEHTWFANHRWQVALCQGCGDHIGWRFSGDSTFFALLNNKIHPLKN